MNEPTINVALTQDQFEILLFALGYAAGAARKDKNPKLVKMFLDLKESLQKP